jgi:hypothetical protein
METTPAEQNEKQEGLEGIKGAFVQSLTRNNKKIRADRAVAITEAAQILYKRKVEDLQLEIKRMKRERENMLDLSPSTADSLVLAADFNAEEYVKKDIELGVKIRNREIEYEIAVKQYAVLFGNE